MGSGSLSSDNRSISPTHSDDSRSVTPPVTQQQLIQKQSTNTSAPSERPKPPQRKRRPAPKPPGQPQQQKQHQQEQEDVEKSSSQISDGSTSDVVLRTKDSQEDRQQQHQQQQQQQQTKLSENGLTISHSRNSSDSSGYHEPSTLSDQCNTSLPRKTKSVLIENCKEESLDGSHSRRSVGNLTKMSLHSKSTTSLQTGIAKRNFLFINNS